MRIHWFRDTQGASDDAAIPLIALLTCIPVAPFRIPPSCPYHISSTLAPPSWRVAYPSDHY
jgi:hypothetical protein